MATKEYIVSQLKRLATVHQNISITPDMINEYVEVLSACLPEDLKNGTDEMIANNKYFPKVAEIWQASEKAMLTRLELKHGKGNANITQNVVKKQYHGYQTYLEEA
jgi:hypothetical protein